MQLTITKADVAQMLERAATYPEAVQGLYSVETPDEAWLTLLEFLRQVEGISVMVLDGPAGSQYLVANVDPICAIDCLYHLVKQSQAWIRL